MNSKNSYSSHLNYSKIILKKLKKPVKKKKSEKKKKKKNTGKYKEK
jgi:hypothetical protein